MGPAEELVRIAKKLDKMVARKSTVRQAGAQGGGGSVTAPLTPVPQTTRIGVAVNSVRKHCSDEEVVASAKILIKNWKRLLGERGKNLPKTFPKPPQNLPGLSRSNSSKAKAETPRTPSSPPFSPSVCLLPPCYLTGDSVRDKCIEMLTAALRMDGEQRWGGGNKSWGAGEGRILLLWLKSTDMKYRNRVRSRISNLKDPKNPNLRRNVLCGAILPGLIARMTAEEMASDELKELRNAMTQEAIREHQMAKTGGTVTDLFQCGKCKKKNCTYNQVQTRSADEPMTTFVLCNECGNRWKVCTRRGGGALGPPGPPLSHPWDTCPLQHPCPCPPPPPSPPWWALVWCHRPVLQHSGCCRTHPAPTPHGEQAGPNPGGVRAPQNCPERGLPAGCPHPTLGFSFAVLLTAPGGAGGDTARRGHGDDTWEGGSSPPAPCSTALGSHTSPGIGQVCCGRSQ
uniref:Transcription elongation factor A3 n=1 Tax=Anser brachyrhynchus TaxID=132585 RepID=A0A8B9BEJ3_9AVES